MSTIAPIFSSGDSVLANTRVDVATGAVVQSLGGPNERTSAKVSSTAPWAELAGFGVGKSLSGHTAVACRLFANFGPEIGGRSKVVIFGGQSAAGLSNQLFFYIPADGSYSFFLRVNGTEGVPTARAHHSAVIDARNVLWIFFGRAATGVVGDVWSFDLAAAEGVWVKPLKVNRNMPAAAPREGHSSCLMSGQHVLIFGGSDADGTLLSDTWAIDLLTEEWTSVPTASRPSARRQHSATAIDGTSAPAAGSGGVTCSRAFSQRCPRMRAQCIYTEG